MNQPQVALLDQIQQGEAAIHVAPRNLHHQSKVALDHPAARGRLTLLGAAREVDFLIRGEQGRIANLTEVQSGRIHLTVVKLPGRKGVRLRLQRCRGSLGRLYALFIIFIYGLLNMLGSLFREDTKGA